MNNKELMDARKNELSKIRERQKKFDLNDGEADHMDVYANKRVKD
jgi:hypothetical protein